MRPLPGDCQALGPGRLGRVRLLRLPLAPLLGLRLHLVATLHGLPIAYALTGAKADERTVLTDLIQTEPARTSRPRTVIGDKFLGDVPRQEHALPKALDDPAAAKLLH